MGTIRKVSKALFALTDQVLRTPTGPRLLIYHQVGVDLGRQMEVAVDDFRNQLDWLVDNYEIVDLDGALARWTEKDSERLVALTFDDGYMDTYTTAFPLLRERGLPFTLYLASQFIEWGRAMGPSPKADPLNWGQVNEMMDSGLVTLGSHTHRHTDLRMVDEHVAREELSTADELIEERTGVSPDHFAYPWGYWSSVADTFVRTRYRSAVVGGSPDPPERPDQHRIHRYPVQRDDGMFFFKRRIQGGLLIEERLRRYLRGYTGP